MEHTQKNTRNPTGGLGCKYPMENHGKKIIPLGFFPYLHSMLDEYVGGSGAVFMGM